MTPYRRMVWVQALVLLALADVTGTWSGAWHEAGMTGALELRLVQDGENVRGDYDSGGGGGRHGDLKGLRITGTLKGHVLVLESRDGQHTFDGTVKGDTFSGTYYGRYATKRFAVTRTAK